MGKTNLFAAHEGWMSALTGYLLLSYLHDSKLKELSTKPQAKQILR